MEEDNINQDVNQNDKEEIDFYNRYEGNNIQEILNKSISQNDESIIDCQKIQNIKSNQNKQDNNPPDSQNDESLLDFRIFQNIEINQNRQDRIYDSNQRNEPPNNSILISGENRAFASISRRNQIERIVLHDDKKRLKKVFRARKKKKYALKKKNKDEIYKKY